MHPSIEPTPSESASADEGTSLLLRPSAGPSIPPLASSSGDGSRSAQARRVLLSTTLSRLGSRSWEFATPLLLLEWSPGSLAAPAALGLTCAFARTTVSPWLGGRADSMESRFDVVLIGAAMQALGCLSSVGALILWNAFSKSGGMRLPLLVLVICAGVVETLGAQLASVAVKKEWVPIVFDEDDKSSSGNRKYGVGGDGAGANQAVESAREKSRCLSWLELPPITLSFINTTMTNIDLICAMFGPVLAGWILQVLGGGGDRPPSMQRGFAAVALMNVISFAPEMVLLQKVYRSCPALRRRRGNGENETKRPDETEANAKGSTKQSNGGVNESANPWITWFHHPSGLPLLSVSLASLYLTALSPQGVVLTAYLVTIGLSPTSIGIFRAIGSFSGVAGIGLFSLCRKWGEEGDGTVEHSLSVRSIIHLRRISMAFLLLEVVSVLIAAVAHHLCETSDLISSVSIYGEDGKPLPWQIVLFLSSIIVSRAGLYSFDVGALEIEQYVVDERYRNAVGSVEGALCSLAEMGMYFLSIVLPDPADFGWQVGVSATAVTTGGICFASFLCLYHMHGHCHHPEDEECTHIHHHDHNHHHDHGEDHAHTMQQERDLKEFGYHVHLHRSSPSLHYTVFKNCQK